MKTRTRNCLVCTFSVLALAVGAFAAEDKTSKEEKKSMRVLSGPREPGFGRRDGERGPKVEMETVAFLGVETAPVATTTSLQLGLPRGTGLVVHHVVEKSPADGVLNEHDILLKLDDQILIETRQLSVLIRNHKEGDEVTLSYMRGGQKAAAKLKLGKTEAPKMGALFERFPLAPGAVPLTAPFDFGARWGGEDRADVDRVLSLIKRARGGEPARVQIESQQGPAFRAMTVHTGDSTMVFSDEEGSLELTAQDGSRSLVARDGRGEPLFSGPVNTPEERKAMPEGVRARLEKLEGLHDITFRTDGDFRGAQMKVLRPSGISFSPRENPQPARVPAFY